jgi:hypothetical protein
MKRRLALLATSLLLVAARAGASDCTTVTSISEAKKAGHEFVLKAKVMRVREAEAGSGIVPVMFTVLREYSGAPGEVLTVYFDPRGDARVLNFHAGDLYLISTLPPASHSVGNACTLRKFVGVSR